MSPQFHYNILVHANPVDLTSVHVRKLFRLNTFSLRKKKHTIHQVLVTTMLATSMNILLSGPNHPTNQWCWWPDTLILTQAPARLILKVKGH